MVVISPEKVDKEERYGGELNVAFVFEICQKKAQASISASHRSVPNTRRTLLYISGERNPSSRLIGAKRFHGTCFSSPSGYRHATRVHCPVTHALCFLRVVSD